jgi:serine/threonine protein kinase
VASTKTQRIPFGKYLLLDRISVGGMAEVWRGKTRGLTGSEELVAIKRILPGIAEDKEFVSMFIDEAKITVQLTHPNIGQVLELGQINGSYFIAMEYIPAKDLRAIFDHCRRLGEPAPVALTCYVVSLMCDALDHAHRKKDGQGRAMNIIHRDVSPQNILITFDGDVKVIDFGIAKAAGRASRTQAGILKGKFAYMSPEQVYQSNLDQRSDVFSIGTCFHELLTGERLFASDSDFAILEKVRKADVPPPSKINPRVPLEVDKISLRALAREAADRYAFASEIADDLRRYLSSLKEPFGQAELAAYMASQFGEELEAERTRLKQYAEIKLDERVAERSSNSFAIRPGRRSPRTTSTLGLSLTSPSGPIDTRPAGSAGEDEIPSLMLEPQTIPGGPPSAAKDMLNPSAGRTARNGLRFQH